MKAALWLVGLLGVVALASATKHVIAVHDLVETRARNLINRFDVRGIFDRDVTLIVGTDNDLSEIQKTFPKAIVIARYQPEKTIVVFEKQDLVTDNILTVRKWRTFTEAHIQSRPDLKTLLVLPRRIIVQLNGDISSIKDLPVSPDTEVVPLLKERMRPIRTESQQKLQAIRKTFRSAQRQADIPRLLSQVNQTVLRDFIEYLSGEASSSPILTRNSYSVGQGVQLAADFIQGQYNSSGLIVTQETFRTDMGPNVIALLPGAIEPNTYVVIGAHYDSRGPQSTSPTQRAPGANDDGSGTGALLQIAKIIKDNNIRFRYSVILGSWCGEEQGLVGSRAYALKSAQSNINILAMLQADMIAYRASGEAAQCAFPDRYDDKDLTALAIEVINQYVPEVKTCYTPACCSDHQSFYEQGYPATQIFERCGSIADNRYHDSADLVNRFGYDFQQLQYNTQALLANLLVLGEAL